jgi:hypothetical protein
MLRALYEYLNREYSYSIAHTLPAFKKYGMLALMGHTVYVPECEV